MKNHDEFRKTVFEKAQRYEARKKARRKQIFEHTFLILIVSGIFLTAYVLPLSFSYEKTDTSPPTVTNSEAPDPHTDSSKEIQTSDTLTKIPFSDTSATTENPKASPCRHVFSQEFTGSAVSDPQEPEYVFLYSEESWDRFLRDQKDTYPKLASFAVTLPNGYFAEFQVIAIQYEGAFPPKLVLSDANTLEVVINRENGSSRNLIIVEAESNSIQSVQFRFSE